MLPFRFRSACRTSRRATAAVEFTCCVPVMMVLVLGAIETSDVIFLRQILMSAAYEGARTATAPGKTAATGITAATAVLTQRGVKSGTAVCTPSVTAATTTGTSVTFTVTAPMASNCCITPVVITSSLGTMTASVTMIRQ